MIRACIFRNFFLALLLGVDSVGSCRKMDLVGVDAAHALVHGYAILRWLRL